MAARGVRTTIRQSADDRVLGRDYAFSRGPTARRVRPATARTPGGGGQQERDRGSLGGGRRERFAEIAAELVRLKVDVIVTYATPPVLAAKQATSVIPIVFASVADPVGTGLVASLARPGGNATGMSNQ